MADKNITRRLKIYVNGNEVDATITNLRKNLAKFRTLSNKAVEGTDKWKKYNAEVSKLETELKDATSAQKKFRQDTKLTEQGISKSEAALSEFTGSFKTMIDGYKRGDILQVKEGWNGVRKGIRGATKAALAFIATPIGAAIAALVLVGAAAKQWFDYNSQVVEALRLTQQITGLTDQAADSARIRAEALSETFDTDFKETLLTANALAQQFGITFEEAFDVIEGQLVRGQKHNTEFFDNLNEYPTFFKQAGFSAEEFGKIIATGFDLGIYKDKLPDAIKEFDLAIKEQTATTRDALVNAFGAPFADDILQRVKAGQTTSKEALEEIAVQAKETNIDVQKNAQLTADLFKGAGEDAGGALKVFEAYTVAIVDNQRELTESEEITQEQINATKALKEVSSALFSTGDKGFGLLIDRAKLFGTKILVGILETGVDLINWFVDLNNKSAVFSGIVTTIGKVGSAQVEILVLAFKSLGDIASGVGDIIEGVFTFDAEKIAEGFVKQSVAVGKFFTDVKKKAIADASEIQDAFSGKKKLKRVSIGDFTTPEVDPNAPKEGETKTVNGVTYIFKNGEWVVKKKDGNGDGDGELTAEDKRIIASKKKLAEFLKQLQEEEAIRKELEKVVDDAKAEEEEVLRLQKKFEKMAEDAGLSNELLSELSETEKDLKKQLAEAEENEIQVIREKHAKIREKKHEASLKKIAAQDAKNKLAQINAERELQAAKRGLLDTGINALQGFFDKSSNIYKALFLGEKAVAAARVVVDGISERAKISAAWGWNPAVSVPLLTASKIRTVSGLVGIAASTIQGFEDGGYTFDGPSSGGIDGRGGRLSILHPQEYVIPKPQVQAIGIPRVREWLDRKSPNQNNGSSTIAEVGALSQSESPVLAELAVSLERLNDQLDKGITIEYTLNSEVERRELAEKLDETIKEAKG